MRKRDRFSNLQLQPVGANLCLWSAFAILCIRFGARSYLRDELLNALRRDELELYYQPQVDLADRRIVGLEALISWNHPFRGVVAPAFFLPALDQSALALEIGWWTLDQASKRAGELQAAGHPIRVSVNLFPGQERLIRYLLSL